MDLPVRDALPSDNHALIEIERESPQGTSLSIYSERDDYFFRSKIYGNHKTLVATNRGAVIGVMAGTLRDVRIGNETFKGACFYDLRLHPRYRKTVVGRHMLQLWNTMEAWASDSGADFIYGYVKGDNQVMLGFRDRKHFRTAGHMAVTSKPVYRELSVSTEVTETADPKARDEEHPLESTHGSKNLFPLDFGGSSLTSPMRESGLFTILTARSSDSYASVGLYRISDVVRMRILKIPFYYRMMKAALKPVQLITAVPNVPERGGSISYLHLFNHTAIGSRGVQLWKQLIRYANNVALIRGDTLLTASFDQTDPLAKLYRHGALNTIDYHLGIKDLTSCLPSTLTPFFVDVRDMD